MNGRSRGPGTPGRGGSQAAGSSRSAAGPVLREAARRFGEGRAHLDRRDWSAWLRTVAIGFIALLGVMVVLRVVAERMVDAGTLDWEADFLRGLGEDGPLKFSSGVFFQTFGTDITLAILIAATAGIAAWCRRPITALSIPLAALGADLVGRFGWLIWDRARPDVLYDGIASPGFHSFPSGHTSKSMAVYGLLVYLWLRRSRSPLEWIAGMAVLLFVVTIVPLGRMTMGVHWPSDIAGGIILGLCWLGVLVLGLRYEREVRPGSDRESAAGRGR